MQRNEFGVFKVEVPTISGPVSLSIPKGASSGRRLRLKGKGIVRAGGSAPGDQYVRLKIVLPDGIDSAQEDIARRWREASSFDARAELRRKT